MTLRLVKRPTVSLRGRVLGPGGLPVAGAQVRIGSGRETGQNVYGGGKDEETVTGPDGTFRTPDGVPRSDQYRRLVTAPGMEPGRSGWANAPAVDAARRGPAPVVAAAVGRRPGGRRRRSSAVAGAEVFQSGDGPRRTSDTTDDDGRFTIPGVYRRAGVRLRQEGRLSLRGPADRGG